MGIFDIFGTGDQRAAANAQINGINTGLTGLTGAINTGNNDLTTNFSAALAPFLQNFQTATSGENTYADALGLNGPQGNARAQQSFQNNPGNDVAIQRGDAAITAADAASGKTGSGNEALALGNYNTGTTSNNWNSYVQSLQPFLGQANTSAAGIAGVDTGLGTSLNSNQTTLGNANYGADTSIGNANANADLAGLTASGNILGALGGIGKAALGSGGLFGTGGFASGLSSFLSDARAKDDIEPVGELFDGQKVYRYRYKGDNRHQIGLIAQEVERRDPDAVGDMGGLKGVDYHRATSKAAELGRFLEAA